MAASAVSTTIGRFRWRICAVLFLATTINYIDRNVFSFTMLDTTFRHQMLGIPLDQRVDGRGHGGFPGEDEFPGFDLQILLRVRLPAGRLHDRPHRRPPRLHRSASPAGVSRPCCHGLVRFRVRHGLGARPARRGRGGQFPRSHQDGLGVVPPEGTQFRHRASSMRVPMSASSSPRFSCRSSSPTGAGGPASS